MQTRRFALSALSLAVLSSLGSLAHAQEASPTAKDAQGAALEAVQVKASADASAEGLQKPYAGGQVARGGRVGVLGQQDNMETPFSVTSYTQELIQNQQAASVGDVLLNDPAVRVARGYGNYQQLYIVRGLPIFSDDMSYNGLYGLLPRQWLSTELIERVEVLRGANAFLNGAAPGGSGLGGAVNVVPKRASNEALSQVTVGVQSGGQGYVAADLSRRVADDRVGIRVNVAHRNGDTAVDGESSELTVAGLGLDYRDGKVRVSADVGYQDHHIDAAQPSITFASGVSIPNAPDASKSVAQPWTYSDEKDSFGTVRGEYDFTSNITGWVAAGVREGREKNSFANPSSVQANGDASESRFDTVREDSIQTGEVGVRGNFKTGSVGHKVSLSAMGYQSKSKQAWGMSSSFSDNIYNHVDAAQPGYAWTGGRMSNPLVVEKLETSSVALADVLSFFQDTLLVTAGARYQKIDTTGYDYNTGAQSSAYAKSAVTPVGGIVYRFTPHLSAYVNYIEGLVKGDTASATNNNQPVTNAGEVMEPYKTKQVEGGLKFDAGRIGGSVGVFQSRKQVSGYDNSNTFGIIGRQRYRGLELSAYGEPMRGLKVLGGASFLDTDLDGNEGIGAPKVQANLGVEWSVIHVDGLSLDGRVIYTSKQYVDQANTQQIPSWTRLDLGARYVMSLGDQLLTLRARVENVTDRKYWASAGGYPGASYLTVGNPRTYMLSGSIDF
jgi:iron complex outermembrane recepter protein